MICRNGVIYSDLLNRLNEKSEVIKGIARNASLENPAQMKANYEKVFNYLRRN